MNLWKHFCSIMKHYASEEKQECLWIVALSGGVDSTVLLDLCRHYRQEVDSSRPVIALHMNHRLRGSASDADEQQCKNLCKEWEIPLEIKRVDIREESIKRKIGLEEAGRMARHQFFADVSQKTDSAIVLLAHHEDDQLETIVMNMERGAHFRGLAGMREDRFFDVPDTGGFRAIRPLLAISKNEILRYAQARALSWREDASNSDLHFTRNRIRHETLPMLEATVPGIRARLLTAARQMGLSEDTLEEMARELESRIVEPVEGGYRVALSEDALTDCGAFLTLLRNLMESRLSARNLKAATYHALWKLAANGRTGATIHLPSGIRAKKESAALFLHRATNKSLPPDTELILPQPPFRLQALNVSIAIVPHAPPIAIPEKDEKNPHVEWVDADSLRGDLVLRARRNGDRMWPLGASGGKKVKDILIDKKIPQRKKSDVRILADYAGPLWLWPLSLSNRARLTKQTQNALRIEIDPA